MGFFQSLKNLINPKKEDVENPQDKPVDGKIEEPVEEEQVESEEKQGSEDTGSEHGDDSQQREEEGDVEEGKKTYQEPLSE